MISKIFQAVCPHPHSMLFVEKKHTVEEKDGMFTTYKYYFNCGICGAIVTTKFADIDDFDKFLKFED